MKPGTCTGYESLLGMDRRRFLERFGMGLGSIALTDLLRANEKSPTGGVLPATHFPARAKRIIYLFQSGGPSQMDLFDHKPMLKKM
ncbi:MAG: DUF1501 domain-containing protein, partial [Planctomycetota bacterium]|nr:DUF1501 domain-containing protein [Planctomycetota bacterium]